MIRLIIFDAGDILYKTWLKDFYKYLQRFLRKHNFIDFEKQSRLWLEVEPMVQRGKISHRRANEIWLEKLGMKKSLAKEILEIDKIIWKKYVKVKPETKKILCILKKRGYKLAVLSDDTHTIAFKKKIFVQLGIAKFFDAIFTSHSIGYVKPEKQAYLIVLKHFKVRPQEAIFVGHDEDEIIGAKGMGIKAISFNGYEGADFVIHNFKEILSIVEKLSNTI